MTGILMEAEITKDNAARENHRRMYHIEPSTPMDIGVNEYGY
jgi:hypothetical protein